MSGQSIIPGQASGQILSTNEGLSFWGGVDPLTGMVIDAYHPLHGQSISGRVLVMPTTRGSCSGSGVMLDLALNGIAPAAFVFRAHEDVVTLGAMIAGRMFDRPVPVIRLDPQAHAIAAAGRQADLTDTALIVDGQALPLTPLPVANLSLTPQDRAMLEGTDGPAQQIAMQVICAMAALQGATELIDVTQGHIDGCILANDANLRFAERMAQMGGRVSIPTTINAISVDHGNWRKQGVPPTFGLRAARLADAYVQMGARPTFTCAPYLLTTAPKGGRKHRLVGIQCGDLCQYRAGRPHGQAPGLPRSLHRHDGPRAPVGCLSARQPRAAAVAFTSTAPTDHDDALWPMLGYIAGQLSPDRIPVLTGLEDIPASPDDLKAMCAAFGTTSAAPCCMWLDIRPRRRIFRCPHDHCDSHPRRPRARLAWI